MIEAVALAAVLAAGDPLRGKEIYARCLACHALAYDRVGPRHCGLLGRRAGSVPGFAYSGAMKNSGIVWSAATLKSYVMDPNGVVPASNMMFTGIHNPLQAEDVAAYLATLK